MSAQDRDLREWAVHWQAAECAGGPAPEDLARFVRARSRAVRRWVAASIGVGAVGLVVVVAVAIARPDPLERTAMGLLALVCASALAFTWWNWRGRVSPIGESTAAYLEWSARRIESLRRDLIAGWVLLFAEIAILVPWVSYRIHQAPRPPAWPWGLLAAVTGAAVTMLVLLHSRVRRDSARIEDLRQALHRE